MSAAPPKILVIAPDSLTANYVAKRCGIHDSNDMVWVRDARLLNGIRKPQIIEAYSLRSWKKLELDTEWNEKYQAIRAAAAKLVTTGKIDTYALVYCK